MIITHNFALKIGKIKLILLCPFIFKLVQPWNSMRQLASLGREAVLGAKRLCRDSAVVTSSKKGLWHISSYFWTAWSGIQGECS